MSGCEDLKLYPQTLQRDISTTYSDKSNQLECLRSVSLNFFSPHESESFRKNPLTHWLCHAVSWLELSYWVRSRINLCRFFDNLIRRCISAVTLIILICINIEENSRCEKFLNIDFNFYFKLLKKKTNKNNWITLLRWIFNNGRDGKIAHNLLKQKSKYQKNMEAYQSQHVVHPIIVS